MKTLPKAKSENIVVRDLKDEVLIYDLKTNLAVCLNATAANVFNACDGRTSFDRLKAEYNYTDEIILLALDKLDRADLLSGNFRIDVPRRRLLIQAASSAIALPVILNLVAPAAVNAQSGCIAGGSPCSLNNAAACCSQSCLVNDGSPVCAAVCLPDGNPCSLNNAAACCSQSCNINDGNPVCAPICVPNGSPCSLNNAAACCSQSCNINGGNPVCAARN